MCSIFGVKVNENDLIVGRNFDWILHGGIIHFKTPYSSYGINTLGFCMIEQMGEDRPYEGINEKGLFVGMAAVVNSKINECDFEFMNDLGIMRFVLERASNVEQAIQVIKSFRLNYMQDQKYPKVHYFFADSSGTIALYEEDENESYKKLNKGEWSAITNFSTKYLLPCDRYDKIAEYLSAGRVFDLDSASKLLECVIQPQSTIWSSVYDLSLKKFSIYVEQDYINKYTFALNEELLKGNHSIDFGTLKLRNS